MDCCSLCDNICKDPEEKKFNEAMPWVGLYIAAASAVCTLLMAADVFNGFRHKKLWFPCKCFSLNAISLTLLAAAMKLPMDLNTNMFKSTTDWYAKHISSIFMSTAMANFMSSLGSMNDSGILANVAALVILVITIAANVWIQIFLLRQVEGYSHPLNLILLVPSILMLLLLATLVSLAITIPTTKRNLETMYQEQHKVALMEEDALKRTETFTIDKQRRHIMKYFVMAESSSPQFVMARSVVSTTSAVICFLAAIILVGAYILLFVVIKSQSIFEPPKSEYKWSTILILVIQSIGVVVGLIAPILRSFVIVSFKCTTTNRNSFREEFKIENHWIQTLVDWRDSFSALQIRQNKCRKYLHDAKWFAITFCIGLQKWTVLVSKLLVFLSALLIRPLFLCFTHIKKFVMQHSSVDMISNKQERHESGDDTDRNLSGYVLRLEGETELPRRVLENICREADSIIKTGRKLQPLCLIDLLHKFDRFNGVGQFDSNEIKSPHDSEEPPNCWKLPVVTLTSIAIALPNVAEHKVKQLLSNVSEGLSLAKIVEKTLDRNPELVNIKKAADVTWVGVLLYMKWLDIDLRKMSRKCSKSKAMLEDLSNRAEMTVRKFNREVQNSVMGNPLNWPAKVVAANSMYRISRTILLFCEGENEVTDNELFERLSVMIADILAACLTNLPHVITTMCQRNTIEKREKSVHKAFLLLGKTEKVVELLQKREWPPLDHDRAACIEEWRALFRQDKEDPAASASASSDELLAAPESSSEKLLSITVDC